VTSDVEILFADELRTTAFWLKDFQRFVHEREMRYPTLRRDTWQFAASRSFLVADDEQDNSSDQREPAENGGNGNMFLLIGSGMDGAKIQDLFPVGIVETLIGESQRAEDD